MPNLLTAEIIDKVLAANKEIIHLAHNDDFLTLVTQPLYVTHKIWNETRSIGTLAIRIDFSEGQISSPIEIISLTVGYDNPSFPSIPHMGYINQQRQVCWGNYSNMVSSICSDITKLPRHVKMILLFCQSVNAQDLEAVKNFQRLPFEDTSSVIIANCQPKSLDLCWQDLTRNPTSGLGGEFYFVINDSGFPLLLTNIFWQHRYDFVKIKMFIQGHYYQSGESGTKFLSDKWENLKLMQLLDEHSRILSGDEINQLKTTTPKTFRDVPRSVSLFTEDDGASTVVTYAKYLNQLLVEIGATWEQFPIVEVNGSLWDQQEGDTKNLPEDDFTLSLITNYWGN